MNLSALRKHVRKILTEGTQGITLDFSKSENAKKLGIQSLRITDTEALAFLNQAVDSFKKNGVTFEGNLGSTVDVVISDLDRDSLDGTTKGNAFAAGFYASLIACAETANGGAGFMPSENGKPMVIISRTEDNPTGIVMRSRDVVQYINDVQTGLDVSISSEVDLQRILKQVENGLKGEKFSPTLYKREMGLKPAGEGADSNLTITYDMLKDTFLDFTQQKKAGLAGASNAIAIAKLSDNARYIMPGEAGDAENYKLFLEAVKNCYSMTPVISEGFFGGISPENADVANEWQLATLIRMIALREQADYSDFVDDVQMHLALGAVVGGAAYGGARGLRSRSLTRGKERLSRNPGATNPSDVVDPQFLGDVLKRQEVKDLLKSKAEAVRNTIQQYDEVAKDVSARLAFNATEAGNRARFSAAAGLAEVKLAEYGARARQVASDLDDLRRAMGGLTPSPAPPAPPPVPPPVPGGPPVPPIIGAPTTTRGPLGGRQAVASFDTELARLEASIARQEQALADYEAAQASDAVNPLLDPAEISSLRYDLELARESVLDSKKFLAKSEVEQIQTIIDENDAVAILTLLGMPRARGGISAMGWAAVGLSLVAMETLLQMTSEATTSAVATMPAPAQLAFALLTMTQEEYVSNDKLATGPVNDLVGEMTGGNDESNTIEFILEIRPEKDINASQADLIRKRILKMVEASTSIDPNFDFQTVRDGYVACLEILGERDVATTSDPDEIRRSLKPTVKVKSGTGIPLPDIERR